MPSKEYDGNEPLESLITRFLSAERIGQNLDRDVLLETHLEFAESLRKCFANHEQVKNAVKVGQSTLPGDDKGFVKPSLASGQLSQQNATILTRPVRDALTIPPTEDASQLAEPRGGDQIRYFGDYELLEEIARGGMGVVFKARQVNLNRIVALKMILAGQLASKEDIQRFYIEAQAAANLDHPGIVPIFEIGEHQGQHYFSMSFIEGESLALRVAEGPLPPREAAKLAGEICAAIAYAHDHGLIHRDLKPANILIDSSGQPKVTDFGLAKRTEAGTSLTGTGQILGTPAYMPPEQASGKTDEVGPLADVYSLGAILYCLLTGRPPFQAANAIDTLLQVLGSEPVPPRRLNSAIPVDLENICLKCLAKQSRQRYLKADDIAADLRRYLAGEPVTARPITRIARVYRWCHRNPWPTIAGIALLMLASLTGISTITLRERLWRSLVDQARSERLAGHRSRSLEVIAEAAALKNNFEMRQEAIETLISPGVRQFMEFNCATGLHSIGFSEDGEQFAAIDQDADKLKVWSFPSGELLEQRPILQASTGIHEFTGRNRLWKNWRTPDGHRCEAISTNLQLGLVRHDTSQVEIWDLKTSKRLKTVEQVSRKASVRVSSDGRWLAVHNSEANNKISMIETSSGEELGTLNVRGRYGDAVVPGGEFSFSADSTLIAAHGAEGATGMIRIWDIASGEIVGIIQGDFQPTWSKSGYFLATVGPSMDERQIGGTFVANERRSHIGVTFGASYGQKVLHDAGFVHIWKITPPTPTFWYPREVKNLKVAPDGCQVAVNGSLWTFKDGEHRRRESVKESAGQWLAFDDFGQAFAIDAWNDNVLPTSSRRQKPKATALTLARIGQSKTQRFTLREGSVKGFAPANASSHKVVDGQQIEARVDELSVLHTASVAFNGKKNRAVTASIILSQEHFADGETILQPVGTLLEVWDLTLRKCLKVWKTEGYNDYSSVAFNPDGDKVVTSAGNRLVVCDLPTDTRWQLIDEVTRAENHVLFGAEGKRIYLVRKARGSGTTDVIISLDVNTGDELVTLSGHKGQVNCIAISPQGKMLASGGQDRTVRLWNCLTGDELARWKAHDDSVTAIAFGLDGSTLVSGGKDGSVKSWRISGIRHDLSEIGLDWNEL